MPQLTEEKKESIWQTYQKTKDYVKTAEIEGVDPRTVRKIVREKKLSLAAEAHANSKKGKRTGVSKDDRLDPDLRRQLEANKLFERGFSRLQVSKKLELSPPHVMNYYNEFDQMRRADLDQEFEKKRQEKSRLDKSIEECENKLQELKLEIKTEIQSMTRYRSQSNDLMEEIEGKKQSIQDLEVSEKELRSGVEKLGQIIRTAEAKNEKLVRSRDNEISNLAVENAEEKRHHGLTKEELERTKEELERTKEELERTKEELDQWKNLLAASMKKID